MIVKRLRDLREDRDLKQKDVANVLNIPTHTYSNYESGIRSVPLEILIDLASFHNTSVDYLLGITDIKEPYLRKKV